MAQVLIMSQVLSMTGRVARGWCLIARATAADVPSSELFSSELS